MTATARKTAELQSKIASISAELKFWRDASEVNGTWEKHHSQIRRVAGPIETAAARLTVELGVSIGTGKVLDDARHLEKMIIDLHSVWEFFRAKLLLRATDPFRHHLIMADELAWACYQPALTKIDPLRKEPPLAFFMSDTSPYAMSRDQSYRTAIDNSRLRSEDAIALLKSLPIPVIGIPWFQSSHLPDLLIVAHEVGHHVEELGLTEDLVDAVDHAAIDASHVLAWKSWSGEVFADVYATLALGPGFSTALADFLTTAPSTIAAESRNGPNWGAYPTACLRILVSVAVLCHRGFKAEAQAVEDSWRLAFPHHAMTTWENDCAAVAAAIVDHGYCQNTFKLSDIASFDAINQEHAVAAKEKALGASSIGSIDVRELVAASALAFSEAPAMFGQPIAGKSPQLRIGEQIVARRTSGTRSGAGGDGPKAVLDAKGRDDVMGEELYQRLMRLR